MNSGNISDRSMPYLQATTGQPGDAWAREAAKAGRRGGQSLQYAGQSAAPERVASALGLDPGDPVVLRRRLVQLDGRPVEVAESYYPLAVAQGTGLAEPRKIRGGAVNLLAELGFVAIRAEEEVAARPATSDEARILELQAGEWVLDLFRVSRDKAGAAFEATAMTMRAAGRTLTYTIEIG